MGNVKILTVFFNDGTNRDFLKEAPSKEVWYHEVKEGCLRVWRTNYIEYYYPLTSIKYFKVE